MSKMHVFCPYLPHFSDYIKIKKSVRVKNILTNISKYFSFRTKVFFLQNHPFQAFLVSKTYICFYIKKKWINWASANSSGGGRLKVLADADAKIFVRAPFLFLHYRLQFAKKSVHSSFTLNRLSEKINHTHFRRGYRSL